MLGSRWLLNFTITPYIGYRYNHFPNEYDKASNISLNCRARLAAVYNHKKFFMGFQSYADHHRYKSQNSRLISSLLDFSALVGIRF